MKSARVFALVYLFSVQVTAQELADESLTIAYETPFSYALSSEVRWELKDQAENPIHKGVGDLTDFVFRTPGAYTLHIQEDLNHDLNACDHKHFPAKIHIAVKGVKLAFDFSTLRLSRALIGDKPADGIVLTVDAEFSAFDKGTATYAEELSTFGVDCTLKGGVKNNQIILKPGRNTLEFVLSGQASSGNAIQLNFLDFNGEVQPYTLTPKQP